VTGSQRAKFAEELQQQLQKDDLLGSGRGKLDFDKSPLEKQDKKAMRRKTELRDTGQPEKLGDRIANPNSTELIDRKQDQSEFRSHINTADPEYRSKTRSDGSRAEDASNTDKSCVEYMAREEIDHVPENIMGDLESLFTGISPPEPVVAEQVRHITELLLASS
jgi:hypothetical protein